MFHTIKRIKGICGSYKKNLISGIIFSLIYSGFGSMSLFGILHILVHIESLTMEVIKNGFYILLAGFIGQFIFKWLITIKMTGNGYYVYAEKRLKIGDELKKAPMGYFNEQTLGNISTALTSSMSFLENCSMMAVENMVVGIVQAVLTTIILFFFRWEIGLITLIGLLLSQLVLIIIKKKTGSHSKEMQKSKENMVSKVIEYIRGISVVRSFGVNMGLKDELSKALEGDKKANIAIEKKVMPWVSLYKGIFDFSSGIMIMVTGYLFLDEKLTFPTAVLFLLSAFVVYQNMKTMGNSAFLLPMIETGLDRLEEVTNIPEVTGDKKDLSLYDIEMSHVYFGYEKDRKIIHDVSLKIPQGSKTAIIGPSGCGKTTLCNLIMRFFDVDSGSIKIGFEDIKNMSTDSLMSNISTVFQKVYLFHDTIENNIKFGEPNATKEEVIQAAKKACCYDFIMKLPEGFDTIVGESGSTLSGGEKQRISIARAMLKNAPIIILDEATSSVDPENEHELIKAINELTKNKTVISIAHRISTVKEADQIVVINDGRVAQIGTHDELISKEGTYKKFIDIRQKSCAWQI